MNLLLFILCTYGLTLILCYGKIFDRIRPDASFFHCPMCIGFHSGWICHLLFHEMEMAIFPVTIVGLFTASLLSCGTSYLLCMLVDDGGLKIGKDSN